MEEDVNWFILLQWAEVRLMNSSYCWISCQHKNYFSDNYSCLDNRIGKLDWVPLSFQKLLSSILNACVSGMP